VSSDREKIVDKVRALLAMANDVAAAEAEREAFRVGALRFIEKHRIDVGELREGAEIEHREVWLHGLGNLETPASLLWGVVAEHNNCYATTTIGTGRGVQHFDLFGTPEDLDIVSALAEYLLAQLKLDVAKDRPRSRKSYGAGWVDAVEQLLEETRVVVESESKALVPVNTMAKDFAWTLFDGDVQSPLRVDVDRLDSSTGYNAGEMADIGLSKIGGAA